MNFRMKNPGVKREKIYIFCKLNIKSNVFYKVMQTMIKKIFYMLIKKRQMKKEMFMPF